MRSFNCGITLPERLNVARVRAEEHQHVEVELDRIAANLHVAFFENVEQPDLDQFVEFRDFVHGEDRAVHPRNQAEVQRVLGPHAGAGREFGRVDLADNVGELGAWGQPLGVPVSCGATRRSANLIGRHVFATYSLPARVIGAVAGLRADRAAGNVEVRNVRRRGSSPTSASAGSWPGPFSPKNSMSWPASTAMLISGMTVSSYPTMPGNIGVLALSAVRKLSRSSCLTVFGL